MAERLAAVRALAWAPPGRRRTRHHSCRLKRTTCSAGWISSA